MLAKWNWTSSRQEVHRTYFSVYLQIRHFFSFQKPTKRRFDDDGLMQRFPPASRHVQNLRTLCFRLAAPLVATETKMSQVGRPGGAEGFRLVVTQFVFKVVFHAG